MTDVRDQRWRGVLHIDAEPGTILGPDSSSRKYVVVGPEPNESSINDACEHGHRPGVVVRLADVEAFAEAGRRLRTGQPPRSVAEHQYRVAQHRRDGV